MGNRVRMRARARKFSLIFVPISESHEAFGGGFTSTFGHNAKTQQRLESSGTGMHAGTKAKVSHPSIYLSNSILSSTCLLS